MFFHLHSNMSGWQIDNSATVYPIEHGNFPASYVSFCIEVSKLVVFVPKEILQFFPLNWPSNFCRKLEVSNFETSWNSTMGPWFIVAHETKRYREFHVHVEGFKLDFFWQTRMIMALKNKDLFNKLGFPWGTPLWASIFGWDIKLNIMGI